MSGREISSRVPGSDSRRRRSDPTRQRDSRSLSPKRDDRSDHRHARSRREPGRASEQTRPVEPVTLPFNRGRVSKNDLPEYKPMFAMYLDIQKNIDMEDLDGRELKGRWKSFAGKWNRGELAEGWYDPSTLEKARNSAYSSRSVHSPSFDRAPGVERPRDVSPQEGRRREPATTRGPLGGSNSPMPLNERTVDVESGLETEEDEGYGPQLPSEPHLKRVDEKSGPTIPTMQDLQIQREERRSSLEAGRAAQSTSHKQARQSHKAELRTVEDEVAPRAEPGTRERRLEKRREVASSSRAFAESRRGGSPVAAVNESELMGGGDAAEDLEALKRAKEKETRKKNEREIRKEEMLRARAAEREERLKAYRRKEDETMEFLRTLAKQRFG